MPRASAPSLAQAQVVTADLVTTLRDLLPVLLQSPRAWAIRYQVRIRNGTVDRRNSKIWDDSLDDVPFRDGEDVDVAMQRIEGMFLKFLPRYLGNGTNGEAEILVTIKDKRVAFATALERQRLFTWKADGTSAT